MRADVPDYNVAIMSHPVALRARLIFPIAAPPIFDGCVTISGERIVAVGRSPGDAESIDLGDVAILPGLVNAHTHLEFSDLAVPLGEPGGTLPDWIRQLMAHRHGAVTSPHENVRRGLSECLRTGTTTVGEIATTDWRSAMTASGQTMPEVVIFREAIAPTIERVGPAVAAVEDFLTSAPTPPHVTPAISPHAPYTVHPQLFDALIDLARRHHAPLAMHLAETREELELLRSGQGPFRTLLEDLNAWNAAPDARYASILPYLEALSRAHRALVIHGNYLSDVEQAYVAQHSATMSVVYCPRTHAYFGHDAYPLENLLDLGVRVVLGTDSRASNPDLDLWVELQFVRARHPRIAPARLLELATRNGAEALGLEQSVGAIEPGKLANLAVVKISNSGGDPYECLLSDDTRVVETVLRGQRLTGGNW